MKIVISYSSSGFHLTKAAARISNAVDLCDSSHMVRTNPELIKLVEKSQKEPGNPLFGLVVVEIPDNATDWMIEGYDGFESVLYVVDGQIKRRHGLMKL